MSNTIKIKKYSDVIEEYVSAGVITPGMLIQLNSAGTVQAHAAQGGNVLAMFALEDELQGNGIDDDYAATNPVQCWVPYRGDMVNALVIGATLAIGDLLQSNGDGKLSKYAPSLVASTANYVAAVGHGILFTARQPGTIGNLINITVTATGAATTSVSVDGYAIDVIVNGTSATVAEVIAAIQASATANALVISELVGTGTTVAAAQAETFLTGGVDVGAAQIVAQALAIVTPGAGTVRGTVRIL